MENYLGIEFGSTRIKAVTIDENHKVTASSDYTWRSEYKDGIWTYDLGEAILGLKQILSALPKGQLIGAAGVSGMMHGYLAFDENWKLLVPFRTWQNTMTARASEELTALFGFHIPQRWSIAHLYQAILNGEKHIGRIAHITTLAGYMHYLLTGVNAVGIGEASGIFPVSGDSFCYNSTMLTQFDNLISRYNLPWRIRDILPEVLPAGTCAGCLTAEGAALVDGLLCQGTPFAPPEGDAGTGMVAMNTVAEKTCNVSAGTSIFSMVVLEHPLQKIYPEIDIVVTPSGKEVAMVHCNNCTNDSTLWAGIFRQAAALFGAEPSKSDLFTELYKVSVDGEPDCGGVLVCNYMAGESLTGFGSGVPMIIRRPDCHFTLENLMRAMLYSALATLRLGMEILSREKVTVESIVGHGGLFKTPGVGQRYLAAACNAPVTCMQTSGEGGPYGMALLAAYCLHNTETLEDFLNNYVFQNTLSTTAYPDKTDADGFRSYMEQYKKLLQIEKRAVEIL